MCIVQWLIVCVCLPVQIENIDACLSFLAAKGVNIQGLSAEGKLDSCTSAFTGTREVDEAKPVLATEQMCFVLWGKKDREWQLDTSKHCYLKLPGHTTLENAR